MLKAIPMAAIHECHQPSSLGNQLKNSVIQTPVHGAFLNNSCHQGAKDVSVISPNPSCIYSSCHGDRQYQQLRPPNSNTSNNAHVNVYTSSQQQQEEVYDFGDDDEDIDEDDIDEFIDDDCEEDMDTEHSPDCKNPKENEVTHKLLSYLETVNSDIKKYFGKRSGEDACDIFEDKWTSGKSGRELYYADLVRIAQCGDISDDPKISGIGKEDVPCSGKLDKKAGLGPLKELFETAKSSAVKHKETSKKSLDKYTPMKTRNLPKSFFKEPVVKPCETDKTVITSQKQSKTATETKPTSSSTKLPDFSDLLESWTREDISHLTTHS